MSIASEITRLQGCKSDIRTALVNKGVTSASSHNMADFAADISNITTGGATITVTYDSSFYNKTMTCTNGTKTYTKTTTSSGSTTFNVNDEGTWTITCNGVSRTVNVVLSYSTQMAITKTVTVYGAAGATISFTDATGSKTVTLNSSGQGSVDITFIPPSATITFTDTNVAKNPNNLSQNYSKAITITESTTAIYVMPDNCIYWYGNQNNCYLYDQAGMTINTHDIYMIGYPNTPCITNNTAIAMTGTSKVKAIIKDVSVGSAGEYYGFRYGTSTTKQTVTANDTLTGGDLSGTRLFQFNATNGHSYARIGAINSGVNKGTIYAMWVE